MILSPFSAKKIVILTLMKQGYSQYEIGYYLTHFDIDVLLDMFNIEYTDDDYIVSWYSPKDTE